MRLAIAASVVAGAAWVGQPTVATPPTLPAILDLVVEGGSVSTPLRPSDVTVSDGATQVPVQAVRLVERSSERTPLAPIVTAEDERARAAEADRLFGVYIDEYHLAPGASLDRVRAAVAMFLRSQVGPRDLVLVVRPLDSLNALRFTTDRESAAAIVDGSRGRAGDYAPVSDFERQFIAGAPARVDEARRQISWAAIDAMVSHLGRFGPERTTLLVVSDGMTGAGQGPRRDAARAASPQVARAANGAHVAVYAFRPTPIQASARGDDAAEAPRELVSDLAQQTTGLTFDGPEAAEAGLARVQRESGHYYLLTLGPGLALPDDGRLRPLSVSARARTLTLRARNGVARPYERRSDPVSEARATIAASLAVPRHSSPLIQAWFGQVPRSGDATRITVVWEPAPRAPGSRTPQPTPAKVALSASRLDGAELFSGTLEAAGHGPPLVRGTGAAQASFEAPPGPMLVRMDVFDGGGRLLDRDVRDVAVSRFAQTPGITTPAVFRARTVPELRAIIEDEAGAVVPPVATRRFSRTDHLVVRFASLHTGTDAAPVAVRLRRYGSLVRVVDARRVDDTGPRWQVELPLAPLPTGAYTLEFESRAGLASAIERLDIVVDP